MDSLFGPWHPLCLSFLSTPTSSSLEALLRRLESSSRPDELLLLQEHILFPMQSYLKTSSVEKDKSVVSNEQLTLDVLKFISTFVSKSQSLTSSFVVSDMLNLVASMLTMDMSDELKQRLVSTLANVLNVSTSDALVDVYTAKSSLSLAHVVHETLEWATNPTSPYFVSMASFELLLALCPIEKCLDIQSDEMNHDESSISVHVGYVNTFVKFVPGLSTKIMKLLTQRRKRVKIKVKESAVRCWCKHITALFRDSNFEDFQFRNELEMHESNLANWRRKLKPLRDEGRLEKTRGHLLMQCRNTFPALALLEDSFEYNIGNELLKCIKGLQRHCAISLSILIGVCVETVAVLEASVALTPEMNFFRSDCERMLLDMIKETRKRDDQVRNLALDFEEKIFNDCSRLAGGLDDCTEEKVKKDLVLLDASLSVIVRLQDESVLFSSATHITNLVSLLRRLLSFDFIQDYHLPAMSSSSDDLIDSIFHQDQTLLSERTFKEFNWISFKEFHFVKNTSMQRRFEALVKVVSQVSSFSSLVDFLLDKHETNLEGDFSSSLLFIAMLFQAKEKNCDDDPDVLERILIFIVTKLKALRTRSVPQESNHLDRSSVSSSHKVKKTLVATIALITQELSTTSGVNLTIGGCEPLIEVMHSLLSEILFEIILAIDIEEDEVGELILASALQNITKATSFRTVSSLLIGVSDSLSSHLTLVLRHFNDTTCSLHSMLKVCLKCKSYEDQRGMRTVLDGLFDQLFVSWLSPEKKSTLEVLKMLLAVVCSVESGVTKENISDGSNGFEWWQRNNEKGAIPRFVESLLRADEELHDALYDDGRQNEDEDLLGNMSTSLQPPTDREISETDTEEDEGEAKVVSAKVHLLRTCMEHVRHFVSMEKCPEWQVVALEVVAQASIRLNDKDDLLPLVHLCWQPLKLLFSSPNPFVLEKAFDVLDVFSLTASDFIPGRTVKDALTPLTACIRRLEAIVSDYKPTSLGRQSRRLLRKLVRLSFELSTRLDMAEKEVDELITTLINLNPIAIFEIDNDLYVAMKRSNVREQQFRRALDYDAWLAKNIPK